MHNILLAFMLSFFLFSPTTISWAEISSNQESASQDKKKPVQKKSIQEIAKEKADQKKQIPQEMQKELNTYQSFRNNTTSRNNRESGSKYKDDPPSYSESINRNSDQNTIYRLETEPYIRYGLMEMAFASCRTLIDVVDNKEDFLKHVINSMSYTIKTMSLGRFDDQMNEQCGLLLAEIYNQCREDPDAFLFTKILSALTESEHVDNTLEALEDVLILD